MKQTDGPLTAHGLYELLTVTTRMLLKKVDDPTAYWQAAIRALTEFFAAHIGGSTFDVCRAAWWRLTEIDTEANQRWVEPQLDFNVLIPELVPLVPFHTSIATYLVHLLGMGRNERQELLLKVAEQHKPLTQSSQIGWLALIAQELDVSPLIVPAAIALFRLEGLVQKQSRGTSMHEGSQVWYEARTCVSERAKTLHVDPTDLWHLLLQQPYCTDWLLSVALYEACYLRKLDAVRLVQDTAGKPVRSLAERIIRLVPHNPRNNGEFVRWLNAQKDALEPLR